MNLLLFISILLELFFLHLSVELYRDKKIHTPIFAIIISLIGSLMLRNFISLQHYMYDGIDLHHWYSEVMIFFVSSSLVGLGLTIRKYHKPMLFSEENMNLSNLEEIMKKVPMTTIESPYLIMNEDFVIVSLNDALKSYLGYEKIEQKITLSFLNLIEKKDGLKEATDINGKVVRVLKKDGSTISSKLKCQEFGSSAYKIVFFEDYSDHDRLHLSAEEERQTNNLYNELLKIGRFELHLGDDWITCSESASEIIGVKETAFHFDAFKHIVHLEDVLDFGSVINRVVWMSGSHIQNLRIEVEDEVKFISLQFHTILGEKGIPVRIEGIIQDLSRQRNAMSKELLKQKNDEVGAVIQEMNDSFYKLLKNLKDQEPLNRYEGDIDKGIAGFESLKRQYLDRADKKNLMNADKVIETIVAKLMNLKHGYKMNMQLNAEHSLVRIDDESFEQMMIHLLSDVARYNKGIEFDISTYQKIHGSKTVYQIESKIDEEMITKGYAESFYDRLIKIPQDEEDTGLYHAHSIIKKFNGTIQLAKERGTYTMLIEFPSISLSGNNHKKVLKRVAYFGQYKLIKKILKEFMDYYLIDVDFIDQVSEASVSAYNVVIVDQSMASDKLMKLSSNCVNTHFISLDHPEIEASKYLYRTPSPLALGNIIDYLSKYYMFAPDTRKAKDSVEVFDIIELIDETGIQASRSFKNIGRKAALYFDDLKLYNLYYGQVFSKLVALYKEGYHEELEKKVTQMRYEALVLGVTMVETFLRKLSANNYEDILNDESEIVYLESFKPLKKSIAIINNSPAQELEYSETMKEEIQQVMILLEECLETLRQSRPIRSREILQELLHFHSMKQFETQIVEAGLMIQKYHFESAIMKIEKLKMKIVSKKASA